MIHIVWNTIKDPLKRERMEGAVRGALDPHVNGGHWDVKITESEALPGWIAVVVAPNKKTIAWHFHGIEEESPEEVRVRIATLLGAVGL